MEKKYLIAGVLIGVFGIVAALSAYFTIKTIDTVASDHTVLSQIVTLINNSQKQTTPASVAPITK